MKCRITMHLGTQPMTQACFENTDYIQWCCSNDNVQISQFSGGMHGEKWNSQKESKAETQKTLQKTNLNVISWKTLARLKYATWHAKHTFNHLKSKYTIVLQDTKDFSGLIAICWQRVVSFSNSSKTGMVDSIWLGLLTDVAIWPLSLDFQRVKW